MKLTDRCSHLSLLIMPIAVDMQALGSWTAISPEQLDLVFKRAPGITPLRRLLTQDLIALCLCGNSAAFCHWPVNHPDPTDRLATMKEVPLVMT